MSRLSISLVVMAFFAMAVLNEAAYPEVDPGSRSTGLPTPAKLTNDGYILVKDYIQAVADTKPLPLPLLTDMGIIPDRSDFMTVKTASNPSTPVKIQGSPYPWYNCTNVVTWMKTAYGGHLECNRASTDGVTQVNPSDPEAVYKVLGYVFCRCAKGFTGGVTYGQYDYSQLQCRYMDDWVFYSGTQLDCVADPEPGMSTATKAAIGAGVGGGVAVISIVVAIVCYCRRRKTASSGDVAMDPSQRV